MHLGGLRSAALSAVLLAAASGCGGSSSGSGKISVHLMDAPGDYQEVNVDVQEIQINGPGGWTSLGTVDKVIDLLHYTNGLTTTLVNEFGVEAGHYTQLRMILGSRNTLKLQDGSVVDLKVPSGMQSGIKLNVNFDVEPGTTKDVFIDFDAHRSVFVHQAGMSDQYILRPVVFCYAEVVTGSISGTVTDAATHQPIAGAEVTAQQPGAGGLPVVVRSTVTDANGHYVLAHIWVDQTYYVVTQPAVGSKVYGAAAVQAPKVTTAQPLVTQDLALTAATEVGGITGSITPVATTGVFDEAILLQTFSLGGSDVKLRLHTAGASFPTATTESYAFTSLPAGAYSVYDFRTVGDPATASGVGAEVAATVTNGATATANLTAPTLP